MFKVEENENKTPNKTNNESSLKNNAYQEDDQKTSPALLFCESLSDINIQNSNGWTPIYQSIISNNLEALYELLKLGANPDIPNNLGETPLYLSVDNNNYDALIILLQYNANCNIAKNNGNTPLHLATKKNQTNFMSALLRNNADPNIVNKLYSQSSMHLAVINKVEENILVEFNMSKADIYNIKDKYDKSPFDYAKDVGDKDYINLLIKIFGEFKNDSLNGSDKKWKANTSNPGEFNKKESPAKINIEYKNNSNFENNKVLFSFAESYLNKNNSSVIIKSVENKNLFNDGTEQSKSDDKNYEIKENMDYNSSDEKNKSGKKKEGTNENSKSNDLSQEKKEENKNNSTDTIKKLSLSNSSEMKLQIEKNKNQTISYNTKENGKNINNTNTDNKKFSISNNSLKIKNSNNSMFHKSTKKDISEMNPLEMINQVITTSSNVFSELQINSNNNRSNQSDDYFNNKSGTDNLSNLNNLMINDSLEYSKTNTHLISDASTKRQYNEKSNNNENIDINNIGLNITINEYEDTDKNINNINNNTNSKKKNKNKQLLYHKQNISENKENINSNEKRKSNMSTNNNSVLNNIKKISGIGNTSPNQNEQLTQNSTSQGENIITKVKYYNAGPSLPENQKERMPKDLFMVEDQNKFLKNNNITNNNYNIKSFMDRQSTLNTFSNNFNNKSNKYASLKISELDNNTNSFLLKNINKSDELNICSPQTIQNDILSRLRDWLISCDLLCYYNLLIKNDMYDIDFYIKNLKENKINISYKDIEDIGIKKPGHIFRFLLRLQIDSGVLNEQMCNLIINKFSTNLLTTIGLTASTNIVKCCGMTLLKQNGDESNYQENKNICCTLSDTDNNSNNYNDIFGFLKNKGLLEFKENFIHNGFDQIDYIFIQLFSNFKFNKEILNDYMHIYSDKDKRKVIKQLYEEKRKVALELGLPYDINEGEQILNTKSQNNTLQIEENSSCFIF